MSYLKLSLSYFMVALVSAAFLSCGTTSMNSDFGAETTYNDDVQALVSLYGNIGSLIQSSYATCANTGATADPLINKICQIAQAATIEEQVQLLAQLGQFQAALGAQIAQIKSDIINEAISVNNDISYVKGVINALINQINDPTSGLVALQTAILSLTRNSYKLVKTPADFPAPVGGIITLASKTDYEINGNINIDTNQIKMSDRTQVYGLDKFNDSLTYTGISDMFYNTLNENVIVRNLTITSSGNVFNLKGDATTNMYIDDNYFSNCNSLGKIVGGNSVWIYANESNNTAATGMTGIDVSGTVSYLNFSGNSFTNTSNVSLVTMLSMTSGAINTVRIDSNNSITSPANTLPRAFNITTTPTIKDGRFTNNSASNGLLFWGVGTQISKDLANWWFENNTGFQNSTTYGSIWISGAVAQAVGTNPGATYVPVRGTFSSNYNERMMYEVGLIEDVRLATPTTATTGGNLQVAVAGAGYTANSCITITGGGGSGVRLKLNANTCGTVGNYPNINSTVDYLPGSNYTTGVGLATATTTGGTCVAPSVPTTACTLTLNGVTGRLVYTGAVARPLKVSVDALISNQIAAIKTICIQVYKGNGIGVNTGVPSSLDAGNTIRCAYLPATVGATQTISFDYVTTFNPNDYIEVWGNQSVNSNNSPWRVDELYLTVSDLP